MKKFVISTTVLLLCFSTSASAQQCVRDSWGQVYCQQGYQVDSWGQQRRDQQVDQYLQQQELDRQQRQYQEQQQRIQNLMDEANQEAARGQQNQCRGSTRYTFGC